jgi:hypothetical protein
MSQEPRHEEQEMRSSCDKDTTTRGTMGAGHQGSCLIDIDQYGTCASMSTVTQGSLTRSIAAAAGHGDPFLLHASEHPAGLEGTGIENRVKAWAHRELVERAEAPQLQGA